MNNLVASDRPILKPVGVFFSYATEDADIVRQFELAFAKLNDQVGNNIKVFVDRSSMEAGQSIEQKIRDALIFSEYLVVIYTGQMKRSFSWTGIELGFYQNCPIDHDNPNCATARKIITMFVDDPPEALRGIEGICLKIEPEELNKTRPTYEAWVRSKEFAREQNGALASFLNEVARESRERFPDAVGDARARERDVAARIAKIDSEIIPDIWMGMYDCLGSRVARRTIEQRLIEFEIDGKAMSNWGGGIPDDTVLTEHGNAFWLFGLEGQADSLSWRRFREQLSHPARPEASSIIRSIEHVFDTALSNTNTLDNDQLIRAPRDQKVYRIIVTRHYDYFNGRKIVHIYFIEIRRSEDFGDQATSILLAFINVTARYRFIFLEQKSTLSVSTFRTLTDDNAFRANVRRLVQELILIEDESARLDLSGGAATITLWTEGANFDDVRTIIADWIEIRAALDVAADGVLGAEPGTRNFQQKAAAWIDALTNFTARSMDINAKIGLQALKRLKPFYQHKVPRGLTRSSSGVTKKTTHRPGLARVAAYSSEKLKTPRGEGSVED